MTIRAIALAIPAMFAGWVLVLASVGLLTDEAPAFVVLFPSKGFIAELPAEISVLSAARYSVTLTSNKDQFARSLYSSGALIVLPAGLPGCLPLPKS